LDDKAEHSIHHILVGFEKWDNSSEGLYYRLFLIASHQKIGFLGVRSEPIHHCRLTNHMPTALVMKGCCAVLLLNWIKPS
jgi:hypothetical protein